MKYSWCTGVIYFVCNSLWCKFCLLNVTCLCNNYQKFIYLPLISDLTFIQVYRYIVNWKNTMPKEGMCLISHSLISTELLRHQQLPLSLSVSPWRWSASKRADRQTDVTVILYLLQVLFLHGRQVAPGDIMFLCMCVCEKQIKKKQTNITQHLPNQNLYSCSRPHHLKQMYLHEALPFSDNLPAPIKPTPLYIRQSLNL